MMRVSKSRRSLGAPVTLHHVAVIYGYAHDGRHAELAKLVDLGEVAGQVAARARGCKRTRNTKENDPSAGRAHRAHLDRLWPHRAMRRIVVADTFKHERLRQCFPNGNLGSNHGPQLCTKKHFLQSSIGVWV